MRFVYQFSELHIFFLIMETRVVRAESQRRQPKSRVMYMEMTWLNKQSTAGLDEQFSSHLSYFFLQNWWQSIKTVEYLVISVRGICKLPM